MFHQHFKRRAVDRPVNVGGLIQLWSPLATRHSDFHANLALCHDPSPCAPGSWHRFLHRKRNIVVYLILRCYAVFSVNREMAVTRKPQTLPTTMLALLIAALLAGCAPSVHLVHPDVHLPDAFEAPRAVPGDNSVTLDRWWQDFHDPR
jgi:hypothetical protein